MKGRRVVILFTCLLVVSFFSSCFGLDPLPSWNEGKTKQALLQFVQKVTNPECNGYVPLEERIATFDQDGTLWVEQPMYTQFRFALDTIKKISPEHPEWKSQEPYKFILEQNIEKIKVFNRQDVEKIFSVTHTGMSVSNYQNSVREWLKTARHPRYQRAYTELIYQPMLELIQYLKCNGFKVYIVSGGGQNFIRSYSEKVYNIPSEQIIGTTGKTRFEYKNGRFELIQEPEVLFISDKAGKPEAINLIIGKRPVAAFGNSDGDRQMLEWSENEGASLQLLVHHDDAEREYAYDADSRIGRFSKSLAEEAQNHKWIIVSMKNDWKILFPYEKESSGCYVD